MLIPARNAISRCRASAPYNGNNGAPALSTAQAPAKSLLVMMIEDRTFVGLDVWRRALDP
jgi:hypothetical protein